MAAYVLVVDDDPAERRHVEDIVREQGHLVESAACGEEALARLTRADAPPISVVILDLVMPDLDGMAVLERLSHQAVTVPVIVQTAAHALDAGAAAISAGAFDFLAKPASHERIRASLANALRIGALEGELLRLKHSRSGTLGAHDIVMHSASMERVHRLAERAARSAIPVLIEGERGVGKELLARVIHGSGPRRSRPFVVVNCCNGHDDTLETLIFGNVENGAQPGGKLAEASGGTLFLDEIGALSPAAQKSLARFLGERSADGRARRGDVRVIAATSRRLIDLVFQEAFVEELFNQLNVLPIWMPPLRERRADVPELARAFLARLATEAGRRGVTGFSSDAMTLLQGDRWPGNLRELEHTIFRAIMLCEGHEITPRELPAITARAGEAGNLRIAGEEAAQDQGPHTGVALQEQVAGDWGAPVPPLTDMRMAARYGVARLLDECGELRPIGVLEEEVIRFAIDHYGGRMSEVARRLGIGRSTLYRKIRDYGIVAGEPVAP